MRDEDDVEQALDACMDAVFEPDQWAAAMDSLAQSLGALGCCLNPNNREKVDRFRLPASSRYRDMLGEFVSGGWKAHDLRNRRGWRLAVAGKPLVFESDCSTPEERARLPIYAELFARHELDTFVGVTLRVEDEPWTFNLVRSEAMGGFEHDDPRDIQRVRPALARMLKVASRMGFTAAQSALTAFEQAGQPAVLLDDQGHVLHVNAAAARLMGDGIDIRHRRLSAHAASENIKLQALIRAAVAGQMALNALPVFLRRPEKPPLIVEATEIRNARGEVLGFNGVLLLISDPAAPRTPRLEILKHAFGLTPQEARVARLMTTGMDAGEIAEILQLQRSSVQQLVKSVLSKTGTRRQGALVAMLARLPGESDD